MSFFKRLIPLKAHMNLNLENPSVAEGTPFKGKAVLGSEEEFPVQYVRMELRVWEKYMQDEMIREGDRDIRTTVERKDTRYSQNVVISQPFTASKGGAVEYPFEVTMPRYAPSRMNGQIVYSLKAVAEVKGRPDVVKEVNPNVLPAPPQAVMGAAPPPTNPIITIKCTFHGGIVTLAPGMSNCPSCGAPLSMPA
jgi:hypothetical protein